MIDLAILRAAIAEGWEMWHHMPDGADRGRVCARVQDLERRATRLDQFQRD